MQRKQDASNLGRHDPSRSAWYRYGLTVAVMLAWITLTANPALAEQIVVVANPAMTADAIDTDDLKLLYLGENEFVGGQKVALFQYADDAPSTVAFLGYFSVKPNQFKSHWIKMVFRTGGVPPQRVHDALEMLSKVALTPGGIGFVRASEFGDAKNVKVLLRLGD